MATVRILYATTYGHTAKVAQHLAQVVTAYGHHATVHDVATSPPPADLAAADAIILGSPVYRNRHLRAIHTVARRHRKVLNRTPSAFFSVSGNAASTRPADHAFARRVVARFCVATGWYPPQVAIIAGAITYTRYPWFTRLLLRWFMARQGGNTDMHRDHEYTDWAAVTALADAVVRDLNAAPSSGLRQLGTQQESQA
jgi:menaquinone-dependent protoporphyrinogen oxidase